jgi:hypothetical protein
MADKDVVVFLVHGTFDGRRKDRRHWTDSGGKFIENVKKRLPDELKSRVAFEPFDWSGENSFAARETAAQELFERLRFDSEERKVLLIGHSHGGTVIADALSSPCRHRAQINSTIGSDAATSRWVGALTLATPFVARTLDLKCGALAATLFAPVFGMWISLSAASAFAIHGAGVAAGFCLAAATISLCGFANGKLGRFAMIFSSAAVLIVPFGVAALAYFAPGTFSTFIAMSLGVFLLIALAGGFWSHLALAKERKWGGMRSETDLPPAPSVDLLALRLPSDEASFAIGVAQAIVWLEAKNVLATVARWVRRLDGLSRLQTIAACIAAWLLGSLVAFFMRTPDSPWWAIPLAGVWMAATAFLAVAVSLGLFLVWFKAFATFLLAKATGIEVLEDIGAVGVYCEPLPRWNSHANCRLEILGWTEKNAQEMPGLRHSMHQLEFVHERVAKWIEERMKEIKR